MAMQGTAWHLRMQLATHFLQDRLHEKLLRVAAPKDINCCAQMA